MICSSITISTPDRRLLRLRLLLALVLAGGLAAASWAAPSPQVAQGIAQARADLAIGDGIGAEIALKRALDAGAARRDIAALMGEAMLDQGNLAKARDWLGNGDFRQEDAAAGFRSLGRLEHRAGNLPAAGRAYDRALALAPANADLWVDIAQLRYAGGEHVLSVEAVDHALALDPDNVRALDYKGRIVRDRFGLNAGLPWFAALAAAVPDNAEMLGEYAATLGDLGRAQDMLAVTRHMLEADGRNPRAFFLQAVLAARAGDASTARSMLNRTRGALDGSPAFQLLDGIVSLQSGNAKLAVQGLDRLVRKQPGNARAQVLLARALYAAGEHKYLVRRFAPLADRPEASPYLLALVGRAYEILGARERAAIYLDRAVYGRPAFIAPVREGSAVGGMLAAGRVRDALAASEKERSANPGSAATQARAGDAQLAAGHGEAALERYSLAAEIRLPESLYLRMIAGLGEARKGGEALALSRGYLAQNPANRAAARMTAALLAQAGDWQGARAIQESLYRSGGQQDPCLLIDLALSRLRTHDAQGAEQAAEAAWRLQPANPQAQQAWGLGLAATGQHGAMAAALLDQARAIVGDTSLQGEARRLLAASKG